MGKFSRQQIDGIFLVFPRLWYFMQIVSYISQLIFWEQKIKMSSVDFTLHAKLLEMLPKSMNRSIMKTHVSAEM